MYFVADESSDEVHRRYFAEAMSSRLPGFADVTYPDWRSLLNRLAADAERHHFRGPIVIDELPYLVQASPELPSILQRWIDHEARRAKLVVGLAGSSQRMMQGLLLDGSAPLYGRATESFEVLPLSPEYLRGAFPGATALELLDAFTAWGGIPRYWELATGLEGKVSDVVDALVLDPLGVLHDEPARLLLEEMPPALETRPLLDAIGAGAHRLSEIAARAGRPATSLSRPLDRLRGMGLIEREVPFGQNERETKRSLHKISDPFFRMWFRIVAPHRSLLRVASPAARRALLAKHWPALRGAAWEQLCRVQLARLAVGSVPDGPWRTPSRWWHGDKPEWDLVSESEDGRSLLLGEAKAHEDSLDADGLARETQRVASKPLPTLDARFRNHRIARALFVPTRPLRAPRTGYGVHVLSFNDLVPRTAKSPVRPGKT